MRSPHLATLGVLAGLLLGSALCSKSLAQGPRPQVTVLPMPAREVPPPDQDLILANLAVHLRQQYRVQVLSGRAVGRAIWGTLGSGIEESTEAFAKKLAAAKQAYQKLQIDRARRLLAEARQPLPICGPEIRDPQQFVDLHLYTGLTHLAEGKSAQAEAEFRQAVSMDNQAQLSPKRFPPDVIQAFGKARKQILSGNPTAVQFLSKPEGAAVYLDGKRVGQTPARVPIYPGHHFIRLEKEGHSPWTLNLPDGVAPGAIRARMVPLWTGEPPEDLVATAIATEDLTESVRARLRLMSGYYQADAFLLVTMNRDSGQTHLGLRLFVVDPEIVTRARLFNLGARPADYPKKIQGIVATFKALGQARARSGGPLVAAPAPAEPERPTAAPLPEWAAPPIDRSTPHQSPPAAVAVPIDERRAPVPIDEQTEDNSPSTAWYKSWWFWTLTGALVAGAAAGVTVYMLQPEGDWTLVIQPTL